MTKPVSFGSASSAVILRPRCPRSYQRAWRVAYRTPYIMLAGLLYAMNAVGSPSLILNQSSAPGTLLPKRIAPLYVVLQLYRTETTSEIYASGPGTRPLMFSSLVCLFSRSRPAQSGACFANSVDADPLLSSLSASQRNKVRRLDTD